MNDTQARSSSITIKKYANRRLYNTATSSYVTLEDLSQMVKDGIEFNVYDAKTSDDITRAVLTQIIVEEESKSGQQNLLPTSFLRQLISFYGDSLQWMVPKYLEHSMEALTGNQDQIRNYFQTTFGNLFPFGTTLEEMSKQNMAMFERTMRMFTPFNIESLASSTSSTSETTSSSSSPAACPVSAPKAKTASTTASTTSTPTNVTPITSAEKSEERSKSSSKSKTKQADTPMPNVQEAKKSTASDDMQQKIANLQRQLADLAKSRA